MMSDVTCCSSIVCVLLKRAWETECSVANLASQYYESTWVNPFNPMGHPAWVYYLHPLRLLIYGLDRYVLPGQLDWTEGVFVRQVRAIGESAAQCGLSPLTGVCYGEPTDARVASSSESRGRRRTRPS